MRSDVDDAMSGELCVYPGSHTALAQYFNHGSGQGQGGNRLADVRTHGNTSLPTGPRTDELFDCPVHHCIGKAGDLFIANYMTAHFIAPNTAPDIRYAVYFRVSAPAFLAGRDKGGMRPESMLEPWCDWHGVIRVGDASSSSAGSSEGGGSGHEGQVAVVADARKQPEKSKPTMTRQESQRLQLLDQELASINYDHTQR